MPSRASSTANIALRQASAAANAFQFDSASERPWRVAVLPPTVIPIACTIWSGVNPLNAPAPTTAAIPVMVEWSMPLPR
jgi:hypothetical protein